MLNILKRLFKVVDNWSSNFKNILILSIVCGLIFLLLSSFFIITKNNIFPIFLFILSSVFLILFRRYRIFCILFALCFYPFFKPINTIVGSFITWLLILYCAIVLIKIILSKPRLSKELFREKNYKLLFLLVLFSILMLLAFLFNMNSVSFARTISFLIYFAVPTFCLFDTNFAQNKKIIIMIFAFFVFLSNLYGCFFFYINKKFLLNFVTIVCPHFLTSAGLVNIPNLRFCGLMVDPNFNGFLSLFTICLLSRYFSKTKSGIYSIILSIILFVFGILSESKAFILITVLFVISSILFFAYKKKALLEGFFILSCVVAGLSILINIEPISKIIQRFLMVDTRKGFLDGFTTGRFELQTSFLSDIIESPLHLFIGRGLYASESVGHSSHNLFIDCIWDSGIFGTIIFITYISILLDIQKNISFQNKLFLIVIILFSLSLDLRSDPFIFIMFFVGSIENNGGKKKDQISYPQEESRNEFFVPYRKIKKANVNEGKFTDITI